MKFIEQDLKMIVRIEKYLFPEDTYLISNNYINPNNSLWIKYSRWPFESYNLLKKVSGIKAFPDRKIKYWILSFLGKRNIKQTLGLFFKLPFQPKLELPMIADFYFNKPNLGILLYVNHTNARVLKFCKMSLFDLTKNKLLDEIKSQKIANKIINENVKTPLLKAVYSKDDLFCFEQELILAKDLHCFANSKVIEIYKRVFEFMFEFYKNSNVILKSPEESAFIGHDFVDEYLFKIDGGANLINSFKRILLKNKKMLWGRTHGDLSLNNILIDKDNYIWIIDWGESRDHYLAKDLRSSNYDASQLYENIVDFFNFDSKNLYTLQEQIFIQDYTELSRQIYNHIVKNRVNDSFNKIVASRIKRFYKIKLE